MVNFEDNKEKWKSQQNHWDEQLEILCKERDEKEKQEKDVPSNV